MSSYLTFYIKKKEQKAMVLSYSRNSEIYEQWSDFVNYNEHKVTKEDVAYVRGEIETEINQRNAELETYKSVLANSKVNADTVRELISDMKYHNERLEELRVALGINTTIGDILDTIDDYDENTELIATIG